VIAPFISVVTPFRNTASYLGECIESVLSQTHSHFEYLLSDNGSSDGSLEIAESYARRDSRIRLIRQPELLSQPQHYNRALMGISDASQYCKIVQADDCIFPECLRLMVEAFSRSDSIGLVSSYDLKGTAVRGAGLPYPTPVLPGKEMARLVLRTGVFVFGSATTVMYRSALVRAGRPFYREDLLHEDTEKCMEILRDWDFGFVHQVLSFLRVDNVNESITAGFRTFQPDALDRYIVVQRFADMFLGAEEARALKKRARLVYYRTLAREALRFRETAFWQYHKTGLRTVGEMIDRSYLALQVGRELLDQAVNPGATISQAIAWCRRTGRRH